MTENTPKTNDLTTHQTSTQHDTEFLVVVTEAGSRNGTPAEIMFTETLEEARKIAAEAVSDYGEKRIHVSMWGRIERRYLEVEA